MIRGIWYLFNMALLVGLAGLILVQTGRFDLTLGAFRFSGDIRIPLFLFLLFTLLLLTVHRVLLWALALPRTFRRYRREVGLLRGHQALVRSLSALASGDHRRAYDQAVRARRLLPEFSALPLILLTQSAERAGRPAESQAALQDLLRHPDGQDLGVRGLVGRALASGDRAQALAVVRQAADRFPKNGALWRQLYDLECRAGDFSAALALLPKLRRLSAISPDQARGDERALVTGLALAALDSPTDEYAFLMFRRANRMDPAFVPAAVGFASLLARRGRRRAALRVVETAFARAPHPDLVRVWEALAPAQTGTGRDMVRRMKHFERLLARNPGSVEGQMMLARACMTESLWGEAQAYLTHAEQLRPSAGVYKLQARLAEAQGDSSGVSAFLSRATEASADPVWHCSQTLSIYPAWTPLALPHRAFNTIVWGVSGTVPAVSSGEGSPSLLT